MGVKRGGDVVALLCGWCWYVERIVQRCGVEMPGMTTEGFMDMKVGSGVRGLVVGGYLVRGRTDNAGRLSDVHLAGWPRGSAKALSDWVGWRGSAVGSGLTNGSSAAAAKVRHRASECKLDCKKGSTVTTAIKIGFYFGDGEVGNGGN